MKNPLFLAIIGTFTFSSLCHAAGIGGDSINVQTNYPTLTSNYYTTETRTVEPAGILLYDGPYSDDARTSFSVDAGTITITALMPLHFNTADYSGFSFSNLSENFPGTYLLTSSTFTELPLSDFYSTLGHVFAIRLNDAASNPGGQLVFTLSSPVPEPGTYALLLAGLGLMGTIARRRQRHRVAD